MISKPTSTRRRAGGVVFRQEAGQLQYLLVTSLSHPERWVIPAGHVEVGESTAKTALREVLEEAGVEATIVAELGSLNHRWLRQSQQEWVELETTLFLMKLVRMVNPEAEGRQVKFFTAAELASLSIWEESREFLNRAQRVAAAMESELGQSR